MGGKLFNLGRMPQAQYLVLEQQLRTYLDQRFGNDYYRIPRFYRHKPDFGDMDIILSADALPQADWQAAKQLLINDLSINQHKSIGTTFSTVYQGLQVDFFVRPHRFLMSTYQFLCWNDVGNLLGKMFRRFNLKYGEEGLQYVFRRANDGHYQKDIPLTLDMQRILAFLRLDYNTWAQGFDTLDDIYRWVISSPYFSIHPYLLDEDTAIQRRIRQERTTVIRFVEFLQKNQIQQTYSYLEDKNAYLPHIADFFAPDVDLRAEIAREQERERFVEQIRLKFNGSLLMQWLPALSGKSLGNFIQQFKQEWQTESAFEQWAYLTAADQIETAAKTFFHTKQGIF